MIRREVAVGRGDGSNPRDLRPHFLHRDVEGLEYPRREALFLAEQPEQDVLGPEAVVPQRPSLVLSQDDDLAGSAP